jgi:hypothetical protein
MPNFCFDCKDKIRPIKYFMVHKHLWEKNGVGTDFLCVDCFEKRLSRRLIATDLMECFVNEKVNSYTSKILEEQVL